MTLIQCTLITWKAWYPRYCHIKDIMKNTCLLMQELNWQFVVAQICRINSCKINKSNVNYLTYDYVFLLSNILCSYTYANSEKFPVPGFITFTFMGKIHSIFPKCHEKIVCVMFSKLLGHLLQMRMAKNVASVLVHRHLNNTVSAALLHVLFFDRIVD